MQTAAVLERMSAHRCDPVGKSAPAGPGDYSTDESALSLHLDQAGGKWKKEEKPVDFKITHRARNRWGVGARAATQGPSRAIAPDGCPGVLRGPRG